MMTKRKLMEAANNVGFVINNEETEYMKICEGNRVIHCGEKI